MASLKLSHIYKVYDNGHKAVNDFNIDIKDKEFIVFVGPSGCGKSTTLRMIAGLEDITAGDLFIGDTLVNDMEPKDRDIAMVFQSYALYPHMTVYENMAFGLRNRHLPEEVIKQKVYEAAKMLDIEDYLERKPKAMSGGQRQRVALGRALVRDPKVFLLDEPLSNLDAKLRATMRTEITKLHKKLATTFIYVTHDQVEAMTMGTRIVVMKLGYVQQIDTPMNLYNEPYNKFVAGFIGTPQMNFFNVKLVRSGDQVTVKFVDGQKVVIPYEKVSRIHKSYLDGKKDVIFGIRPEHLVMKSTKTGLTAVVNAVEHLGNECIVYGQLGSKTQDFTMKDEGKNVIVKVIEGTKVEVGDVINIAPMEDKVHFFDAETEITLMEKIPSFSSFEATVSGSSMDFLGSKVELVPALAEVIGKAKKATIEVSPYAVVPGKSYKLPVKIVEQVGDKYLAHLECGDSYLFAIVDKSVKEGSTYSFDLLNEKLKVSVDDEVVHEPVGDEEFFYGRFSKLESIEMLSTPEDEKAEIEAKISELNASLEDPQMNKKAAKAVKAEIKELIKRHDYTSKERVYHFFYNVNDFVVEAPVNNGYKMNAVDKNKCYTNVYKYGVSRDAISLVNEGGLEAVVEKVLNYGNITLAKVVIDDYSLLVKVDPKFNEETVRLFFEGDKVHVYSIEADMMIC